MAAAAQQGQVGRDALTEGRGRLSEGSLVSRDGEKKALGFRTSPDCSQGMEIGSSSDHEWQTQGQSSVCLSRSTPSVTPDTASMCFNSVRHVCAHMFARVGSLLGMNIPSLTAGLHLIQYHKCVVLEITKVPLPPVHGIKLSDRVMALSSHGCRAERSCPSPHSLASHAPALV